MDNTLLKDEKYTGRYIAIKDFGDETVLADGKSPSEVFESAKQKGYKDPVILFVPIRNMVQIY
ncbi:hypothetical protein HZB07_07245 [Candidatus Saganbacteria bacterium]|nr:hypothetical protein [Candidatus Saganbacteria bacterium]